MTGPVSPFRPDLLEGKVALVTGGGSGIGLGIAESLLQAGASLAIASRNEERLVGAKSQLAGLGGEVLPVVANVRDKDSVSNGVSQVVDHFGGLDILVNNAAGNFYVPSAEMSENAWKAVLETDLYGTFYCCQAVYPPMQDRGGGRIISVSMTLHYRGWPRMAHATAAKAGVDALTRTLALEWAPDNITVNAVAPGPIPTAGVKKAFTPPGESEPDLFRMEQAAKAIPAGRWGTPADIGHMVTYLASPAADWITGEIVVVDGGSWLAGRT